MRLLITRPEPDASATAARLATLGHETVIASMLVAEFLPEPAGLERPSAILLTSGNATRALARWPNISDWLDIPVFSVGDHTAQLVAEIGFREVQSASGDVDDLTTLVRATRRPRDGRLLYPTTKARMGRLAEDLDADGYTVETLEIYRMNPRPALPESVISGIGNATIDGVLLYSQRTAAIFAKLVAVANLRSAAEKLKLFAISPNTAVPLDFGDLHIAAEPTENGLFDLLG